MVKRARLTDEGREFMRSIDDAFCKPTPESHVQQEIEMYCNCCERKTVYEYHGTQFHLGYRAFDLYNCTECGATQSANPSDEWLKILEERKHDRRNKL